jgi:hypothetical protein
MYCSKMVIDLYSFCWTRIFTMFLVPRKNAMAYKEQHTASTEYRIAILWMGFEQASINSDIITIKYKF